MNLFCFLSLDYDEDEYDSADSLSSDIEEEDDDDDVFADPLNNDPKASQASAAMKKHRRENTQHSNPYSYSWLIMRTAILRIAQNQLQDFIAVAGIEMQGIFYFYFWFIKFSNQKSPCFPNFRTTCF